VIAAAYEGCSSGDEEIAMKWGVVHTLAWPLLVLISATGCRESDRSAQSEGSNRPDSWAGTYTYTGSAGETAGGTPVSVAYRLVLDEKHPGEGTLIIRGYQIDETIRCEIVKTADRIEVKFRSYASGKTTNEFGVQQYQPGGVLFTLERVAEGNQEKLLTNWKSLRPDTAKSESGQYFTKGNGV
jgi:hypothetical protein